MYIKYIYISRKSWKKIQLSAGKLNASFNMGNMTGPRTLCTEVMLASRTLRQNSRTTPEVVLACIIHNHWRISSFNYHVLPSIMVTMRYQSLLLWGILVYNEPLSIWDLATYCHRWWSQGDVSHSPAEESSCVMKCQIFGTKISDVTAKCSRFLSQFTTNFAWVS